MGGLERLKLPELPFLYLQNEKGDSYLLRVEGWLTKVMCIWCRGERSQHGVKMLWVQNEPLFVRHWATDFT